MRQWLRSVLREPSVDGAPKRVWRDTVLVGVAWVASIIEALLRPDLPWRWATLVLALVLIPTLLWRRSHPLPVMVACFAGMTALAVADLLTSSKESAGLFTMAVLIVSLYALSRWGSGRDLVTGIAVAVPTAALCIAADYTGVGDSIGGFFVLGITIAVGLAIRFRGRARQREIEQVRFMERADLARDLHDTVAHHVSAIAIRAQAGIAVAATRPDAALEALHLISTEASRTLTEMRAMVGVLRRDQHAELMPTPSLADLTGLARHAPGTPRVEVSVADCYTALAGSDSEISPAVQTAVFRIAQEAVTNAQRYARNATRVQVTVTIGDGKTSGRDSDEQGGEVHLWVTDDGDVVDQRRVGDGYGIRGMAERAELLGGSCVAGPGEGRGWVVIARFPRSGVAA